MIVEKLISLPGLLVAIIFHELAHGYTSYKLGDPTPKKNGRLTLNPISHIDPIGFLCLIIFKFGWAKPVPINPSYYKHRKKDTVLVSIAGPITNLLIALLVSFIISRGFIKNETILNIFVIMVWYNIMLGIFNLIPLPPLDGSKILASLLPLKYETLFYKYEKYLNIILVLLIITKQIDKILSPVINLCLNLLIKIIY